MAEQTKLFNGANSTAPSSQNEPKKRRRKGDKTSLERLEKQLEEMPASTYQATDDDLPLNMWPEPEF
jgi:hypothetical protein